MFLTIMPVTVSIPVERILIAINVRIIAAVVATEKSWFRSDDANNDSQQQDCVLKEKKGTGTILEVCGKCHANFYIYIRTHRSILRIFSNKFLCTLVYLLRPIPSFKFTTLSKNNTLRIIKSFQLTYTNTEKRCSSIFKYYLRRILQKERRIF